jgi:hypothetical protein
MVPVMTTLPWSVLAGFAALPLSAFACWHTWREPFDFYRRHPVQQASLLAFVVFTLGSALGILLG